jgi:indole-3-glycerol phosphate synthase
VKRRAPSAGRLARDEAGTEALAARLAAAYERGGAAAISVLTEPESFAGNLRDLEAAARATRLPVMRKDFLVDPYQLLEARAAGAAGALLILRILDDGRLDEMLAAAAEMGLFVLLEAFDEGDLERAGAAADQGAARGVQALVGLNARDLTTMRARPDRFRRLAHRFPAGYPRVAESGLAGPADAREVAGLGYQAALVGSALVSSADPSGLAAEMLAAGRTATLDAGRETATGAGDGNRIWVKICGVSSREGARAAAAAGADAVGFVFADSPRRVSPSQAAELSALLPKRVERVAVFRYPDAKLVEAVIDAVRPDRIQCEPTAVVARQTGDGTGLLAVFHDGPGLVGRVRSSLRPGLTDAKGEGVILLEAAGQGGRGLAPDWNRAAAAAELVDLVLAGGLTPANVERAIHRVRPFGVDVSSGVESCPGRKDPRRIEEFIMAVRRAEAALETARSEDRSREVER